MGYLVIDSEFSNAIMRDDNYYILEDSSMDKYSMISAAPSLVIVAAMIVGTVVAVGVLKKLIAKDAAKAGQ